MSQTLRDLGIDRLGVAERLELIGQVWDSLDAAEGSVADWHQAEVARRVASADADPEAAIPWEVVKARLADRS